MSVGGLRVTVRRSSFPDRRRGRQRPTPRARWDFAETGGLTGAARARVTQICNLTLLAPGIQEEICSIGLEAEDVPAERLLRDGVATSDWTVQWTVYLRLGGSFSSPTPNPASPAPGRRVG